MNYTITFSPSIDYIIKNKNNKFDNFGLTRIEECYLLPGGKGINASYIMNQLDVNNKAITFTFGRTSTLFNNLLKDKGLFDNLINIPIHSDLDIRINVKYFDEKNSFEINGPSPIINDIDYMALKTELNNITNGDIVFIMGKCDESKLIDLVQFIKSKGADFVIDIDSTILNELIKYEPLVIKPNIYELSRICNKQFKNNYDVIESMKQLKTQGAKHVIVSMGGDGSLLLDDKSDCYHVKFQKIDNIKSTVGCGDTLLTAFATNVFNRNETSYDAIVNATALSISTATHFFLGQFDEINKYKSLIEVTKID